MPKGEVYKVGKFVVLFVMLGKLIDMASGANGEIIGLSKYYKFNMYCILFLAVLTVVGNYFLIPALGVTGAALATAISLFFYNFLKYIFIKVKLKIDPFNLNTIKVLAIGTLSLIIAQQFTPDLYNPFAAMAVKSFSLSLIYGLLVYFSRVSEDVNIFITSIITTFIKK